LISGLIVFVMAAQMVGAAPTTPAPANIAPAPKATHDLRIGFLEAVDFLNPFRGLNDPSYELYGMIYDYLFSFDQDGNFVPNIATDASCDTTCRNWTYTIRQGVTWHDGTALTAEDVNYSINLNIKNLAHLWAFEPYVNRIVQCSPPQIVSNCGASINTPWNVTVYFDRPFVPGKSLFIPIIQKAQWVADTNSNPQFIQGQYQNLNPIGTGPFYADANIGTAWSCQCQPLILHKYANYHPVGSHTGPAIVDNIYFEQFSDEGTMVAALEAGAIDLAKTTPNGYIALSGASNIERQSGLLSTQYWTEIGITQIPSNHIRGNARFDENVRRALAMATNKDFIVQNKYLGFGVRGDSLMSPITPEWWYDPTTDPGANLTFDIAAANALLNQSGYDSWSGGSFGVGTRMASRDITFNSTNGIITTVRAGETLAWTMAVRNEFQNEIDTGDYLATEWAKVGMQLTVKPESESALSADVYGGFVETYIWYWSGDPDPNYLLSIESGFTLDGWNDNYWDNTTYNQLYVDHLAATDPTQRQQIVRAAEKLNYQSAVYIIFIYNDGTWGYRTDTFTGWGDWNQHPYRQMDAFWGANPLFLELQPIGAPSNNCPTTPIVSPQGPITTFVNTTQSFTGSSTDTDQGQNLTWIWGWGDMQQTLHTTTTAVTSDSASHSWSPNGTYSVALSVSDGQCTRTSAVVQVTVNLAPPSTGWINGTVTSSAGGAALAGIQVSATGGYQQTTDAQGKYSIVVPPNTYTVDATDPLGLYFSGQRTGVVVAGDQTAVVDFALVPNQGWITGTVKTAAGAAIVGASLHIFGNNRELATTSDAAGGFNKSVAPGTYSVAVSATGYIPENRTGVAVAIGAATVVTFVLNPVPEAPTGLPPLAYVGLGIVILIAAIAVGAFFLSRRKRKKEEETGINVPAR